MPSGTWLQRLLTPQGTLLAVIGVLGALFGIAAPGFLTPGNFADLVEGSSVTAIMAIGLLVVLVAGGIDISFAATATVAQYAAAWAATKTGAPIPLVIALNLAVGALLGGFNALLIDRLRATSIIITISTLSMYFSLLMYVTGGRSIYNLPGWWSDPRVLLEWAGADGGSVRITLPVVAMAVVAVFTAWLMNRTGLGRQVYAVGGNVEAARRVGIRLPLIHAFVYGYLGVLAAIAGFVQAHRVGESVPNAMVGGELFVLAAAVLGGASLNGGTGTVGGVLLGVLLLAMLRNGLNLMGVSPYFFQVVLGAVVLASAAATGLRLRAHRAAPAAA